MSPEMIAAQNGSNAASERRMNDVLVHLANALLMLYTISIYVWSSDASMYVYSNLLCLATLVVMLLVVAPRRGITITRSLGYLVAFGAFCITSILWAEEPARSITMAFKTLPLLILFAIVLYNYLGYIKDGKEYLLRCIYVSGIVLAVYVIWVQGGPGAYLSLLGTGVRLGGEVTNENVVGMAAAFSFIIAFYRVFYEHRMPHTAMMILCGLVAFGAGSNKALIAMVAGCLMLLVFNAYLTGTVMSFLKSAGLLMVLACVLLTVLQLPMFETINTRFTEMVNTFTGTGEASASTSERIGLTQAGLKQFSETPLLGIGIGNSGLITQQVSIGFDSYLHNNYVELLACVGAVGTFLFYAAVFTPLLPVLKNGKNNDAQAVLAAILIMAWLLIQVGYVSYSEKTTYIYIVLIGLYAGSINHERVDSLHRRGSYE